MITVWLFFWLWVGAMMGLWITSKVLLFMNDD